MNTLRVCMSNTVLILLNLMVYSHTWSLEKIKQSRSDEQIRQPVLAIIDTAGQQEYYYRNLILMARSVGFAVTYHSFYDILENSSISDYDAVFFMTSLELLKNLKHDLAQKFIKILENFSKARDKIIGIMAPATPRYSDQLFNVMATILETVGVFKGQKDNAKIGSGDIRHPVHAFLKYMLQGDAYKGQMYGTTLLNQINQPAQSFDFAPMYDHHTHEIIAALLPLHKKVSPIIQKTLPSGMYLKNNKLNNIYFISKVSEFNFADIAENFFKAPLHMEHRSELLMIAQQMLWELYNAYTHGHLSDQEQQPRPPLPEMLTSQFIVQEKKRAEMAIKGMIKNNQLYDWMFEHGISCAWEAPGDYSLYEDPHAKDLASYALEQQTTGNTESIAELKAQALAQGIDFIYDAHINLIWFEFNPEVFLSVHGYRAKEKEQFIKQVTTIATALKRKFNASRRPMPKVFIGTDITTNYNKQTKDGPTGDLYLAHEPAQDVFNNTYDKIPSAFDVEHFWRPELIDVFDAFCTTFGEILPIDGIFLDFEMYHAPHQAAGYTELMDFSTSSWQHYCKKNNAKVACALTTVPERVNYLVKHKAFKEYSATLEGAALELGRSLKKHLRAIMPGVLIGAYAPTLPTSWFYRGIMAGLSSPTEPLIVTTFNTDFYSHYQWLTEHHMHFIHGAPILLSKFETEENFCLIPELLNFHYFVWYLRPSRMVYKNKQGHWWSSEASPMSAREVARGIKEATEGKAKGLSQGICSPKRSTI